jgi:transcription initiation factor TFIIE subunit alpha
MEPFMQLLREIDEEEFPEITGEMAYHERKPMPKPSSADPLDTKEETIHIRPTDVVGQQPVLEEVEFTMTTESESNAAARAAEAERKKRIAEQNLLPEWHTESTVLANAAGKLKDKAEDDEGEAFYPMDESEDRRPLSKHVVDDFFSQLEKEKAQMRARREQEDEEEQDDEDEDVEFEDVHVGTSEEVSAAMEGDIPKLRDFALAAPNELASVGGGGDGGDGAEESDEDEFENVI